MDREAALCFAARHRRVHGVVLASGTSTRFGAANKLLAPVDGETVVRRTVAAYRSAVQRVWVVVGYDADAVTQALRGFDVQFVPNDDYRSGQSASLRAGVSALPADADAAIIGVADQPLLSARVLRQLVARWEQRPTVPVAPTYAGRRGNPALFPAGLFPELAAVVGDVGGRQVLMAHHAEFVPIDPWWHGFDIDTPADVAVAESILKGEHGWREPTPDCSPSADV